MAAMKKIKSGNKKQRGGGGQINTYICTHFTDTQAVLLVNLQYASSHLQDLH